MLLVAVVTPALGVVLARGGIQQVEVSE